MSIQFADNFRLSFSQPVTGLYLDVSDLQHVSSLGNTLTFQNESHAALNFSLVASNGYFVPSASSLQATPSGSTLANGTIYFAAPLTELYIMSDLKFSDGGYINIGVVPEPDASLGFLWLSSMLGICIFRRRR